MMAVPEFSRPFAVADIGQARRSHALVADGAERAALARRFGLLALDGFEADLSVWRDAAGLRLEGKVTASGSQPCVATADPVPFRINEPVTLLLEPGAPEEDEIELSAHDLDVEPLLGDTLDLGELAAQALGLALDPFPRSKSKAPGVQTEDQARAAASPFAALKDLKR